MPYLKKSVSPMRSFCTALMLFACSLLHSQAIIPRFETLGVEDGLSQSSVYAILQDSYGFMWFGTAYGLNRYDGKSIRPFKIREPESRRGNSNFIRGKLIEDRFGNIWFSSETGVYCYDRITEKIRAGYLFERKDNLLIYFIMQGIDSQDNLWLINKSFGLLSYNVVDGKTVLHPIEITTDKPEFSFARSYFDDADSLWLNIHRNNGVARYSINSRSYSILLHDKDLDGTFKGKNAYYFTSGARIYVWSGLKLDSINLEIDPGHGPVIHSLLEDDHERLWITTLGQGLICYDKKAKKTFRYRHSNYQKKSLPIDILTVLFIDRSYNLWIGTDGGGICKLDIKSPRFHLFPLNEGDYPQLKDYFIKCFFEDTRKRIWFGTHSSGLNIFDPNTGQLLNYSSNTRRSPQLFGDIVGAIFQDKEHKMWIGESGGISIFDEKKGNFSPIPIRDFSQSSKPFMVHRIIQTQNNDLLVASNVTLIVIRKTATGYEGVCLWQKNGIPSFVMDVVEMDNGDIWLGTSQFGLGKIKPTDLLWDRNEVYLEGLDLRGIHLDSRDRSILWIGSDKGLIRFDTRNKTHRIYDDRDGIANTFVYGVLEDENNNLWISTNAGLSYFNRSDGTFENFSVNEGLQSNEFNTGAFYKGPSGTMYFGGIKGFNWFNTHRVAENVIKPQVGITSILIEDLDYKKDSSFMVNKTMKLKYHQNNIAFQIAALDYTRPEGNKIQYFLEGWDDRWVTSYEKEIRYANLSPGNYVLHIRGSNSDGIWSDVQKVKIIVQSPFWQRSWFYALGVAILLFAVVLLTREITQRRIRKKLRSLEKQKVVEDERARISKDMHDEIGSGLTRIALMVELMKTNTKQDIDQIAQSTRNLLQSMSEIIWAMNPRNDKLDDLLAYLREQTYLYFEPLNIKYQVHFPEQIPDLLLDDRMRRNIFFVTKEALTNALKHSGADQITLSALGHNGRFEFMVEDNGKGIPSMHYHVGSNGLKNMQRRMEEIGGGIEWASANGVGTSVHYWIKLHP